MVFKSTVQSLVLGVLSATALVAGLPACSQHDGSDATAEQSAQGVSSFTWKGHTWNVTNGGMAGVAQGSPNNVSVDANGYLHLKIVNNGGTWTAAELFTADKLGFGTYQWQVDGPIDVFDKNVVLGLYPYGPAAGIGADGTNEIDIEYSRWGNANGVNGDWTDYPASGKTIGEKSYSFSLNGGTASTSRFIWNGTSIQSFLMSGYAPVGSTAGLINSWLYAPTNPSVNIPQQALPLGINLWCFGAPPSDGKNVEVVIRDFTFVPQGTTINQFTISASAGANGSISPVGSVAVNQGASQSFTITPNAGYAVNAVTVDGASQGAISSYSFSNVQAAHTISATFKTSGGTTGGTNIAPGGTGYRWYGLSAANGNTNRAAAAGLNDNDLASSVNIDTTGDSPNAWEAAGVIWSSAQSISAVNFVNGDATTSGDGWLEANTKLQFSSDGATWNDSGWAIAPAYPNTSAAAGKNYAFSGAAVSGVVAARVVGQVRVLGQSWYWRVKEVQVTGAGGSTTPPTDTNLAPSGVGYIWAKNTVATANANRTASAGVNDGNSTVGVTLNAAGENGAALWEAAGVLWSGAKTLSSVNFVNGAVDTYGNGFLESNCKLEYTTDGVTWLDATWSLSPAYPFTAAAASQTYTFTGPALSGVLGVRVTGQTGPNSWSWIVDEVRAIGH